jgi:hypothetical protein
MVHLGITLLIVAAVLLGLSAVARVRVIQIQRRQAFRDAFFADAMTLVEDERTPPLVVEVTEFLAETIANKHLTWLTLWRLITGDINRRYDSERGHVKQLEGVLEIPPDLQHVWKHLTRAFVLAITFNTFLIGSLVRRLFLWPATLHDGPCGDADGEVAEVGNERAQVVVEDLVATHSPLSQQLAAA